MREVCCELAVVQRTLVSRRSLADCCLGRRCQCQLLHWSEKLIRFQGSSAQVYHSASLVPLKERAAGEVWNRYDLLEVTHHALVHAETAHASPAHILASFFLDWQSHYAADAGSQFQNQPAFAPFLIPCLFRAPRSSSYGETVADGMQGLMLVKSNSELAWIGVV